MSSSSRIQLEDWLKTLEVKGGKVLDVGGSQNPLTSKRLGVFEPDEYKILDLEVPHECKQKPDYIFDINELDMGVFRGNREDYFTSIFCLEVTEYLWNPLQAFKNFYDWLDVGGKLYISSHFIYPTHAPVSEDCLRFTRQGISKLLEKANFKIESITPRICRQQRFEHSTIKGTFNTNIFFSLEGMRPAKGYDKHFEVGHLVVAQKL